MEILSSLSLGFWVVSVKMPVVLCAFYTYIGKYCGVYSAAEVSSFHAIRQFPQRNPIDCINFPICNGFHVTCNHICVVFSIRVVHVT